jgi:hypothetical protein
MSFETEKKNSSKNDKMAKYESIEDSVYLTLNAVTVQFKPLSPA